MNEKWENKGVASCLLVGVEKQALIREYASIVGQTARPTLNNPEIRGLSLVLKLGFSEWSFDHLLEIPSSTLEKGWVFKKLKKEK